MFVVESISTGNGIEPMFLRKAAEDTAKRYREWAECKALPPGQFFSLTENLRAARNKLLDGIPGSLYQAVLKETPRAHRELLISPDDTDLDSNATLQPAEKGKLKSKRRDLRNALNHDGWSKIEAVEAVDRVLEMTERVLNPASHGNNAPLYEEEAGLPHSGVIRPGFTKLLIFKTPVPEPRTGKSHERDQIC